ncbi:unnamed protein product [Brassica rapa subsp. trilocularis]
MYPTWDNDAVDVSVKNLVEFMFAKPEWKWTLECWQAQGTKQWTIPVYVKKEPHQRPVKEESRAPKKARTEAGTSEDPIEPPLESSAAKNGLMREEIELMFKEMTKVVTAGIGQCVKEIKLLGDRMEAMEKIVGINTKDTQEMTKVVTDGIGQGVKEIKLLGDRMEAMEKIVGINKKNTDNNEIQLTVSELKQNKHPQEPEVRMEAMEKKVGINQKDTDDKARREPGVSTKPPFKIQMVRNTDDKARREPGVSTNPPTVVYLVLPYVRLLDLSESVNGDKRERENTEPGGMKEKSVNILDKTKATKSDLKKEEGRRDKQKDTIMELCRAKSERKRKLAASQKSPFQGNSTAKTDRSNQEDWSLI